MAQASIRLGRVDKIYNTGEAVTGVVRLDSEKQYSHSGVKCRAVGRMIMNPGKAGQKEIVILDQDVELMEAGKLPQGDMEIPFEFTVEPCSDMGLVETYHGVNVDIRYCIEVDIAASGFFSSNVHAEEEFHVETPARMDEISDEPSDFEINPTQLQNVKSTSMDKIPRFSVTGRLNMTNCCLRAPFTGHIVVEESEAEIQSIELQLVRVETTTTDGATTSDATEIQNLQVGDGDVPRGLSIPLYMIFPRLFACPSVSAGPLSVNFELNIHIRFSSDYLVLENFPITLYR